MKRNLLKKLVSIALCSMLAFSGIITANAMTVDGVKASQLAQEKLESEKPDENTKIINNGPFFTYTFNGYMLVSASYDTAMCVEVSNRYGDYIFENNVCCAPSEYGWLAVNIDTGDVITLEKALEQDLIDSDILFEYSKYPDEFQPDIDFKMYRIGDTDNDGALLIKDATEIQKATANLSEVVNTATGCDTVFDYNGDGNVNILDATAVQKELVFDNE